MKSASEVMTLIFKVCVDWPNSSDETFDNQHQYLLNLQLCEAPSYDTPSLTFPLLIRCHDRLTNLNTNGITNKGDFYLPLWNDNKKAHDSVLEQGILNSDGFVQKSVFLRIPHQAFASHTKGHIQIVKNHSYDFYITFLSSSAAYRAYMAQDLSFKANVKRYEDRPSLNQNPTLDNISDFAGCKVILEGALANHEPALIKIGSQPVLRPAAPRTILITPSTASPTNIKKERESHTLRVSSLQNNNGKLNADVSNAHSASAGSATMVASALAAPTTVSMPHPVPMPATSNLFTPASIAAATMAASAAATMPSSAVAAMPSSASVAPTVSITTGSTVSPASASEIVSAAASIPRRVASDNPPPVLDTREETNTTRSDSCICC